MLDMVCAPMPFIAGKFSQLNPLNVAGVLSQYSDKVLAMPTEEVVCHL